MIRGPKISEEILLLVMTETVLIKWLSAIPDQFCLNANYRAGERIPTRKIIRSGLAPTSSW